MSIPQKTSRIILLILCLHIIVCFTFIFFGGFLKNSKISRFYKVYLMPGPFFSEASVAKSYHLLVSWKENNTWTEPINHTLATFKKYQATCNPVYLNESRLERKLYEEVVRKGKGKNDPINTTSTGARLKQYIADRIIPVESDSARITIMLEIPGKRDSVMFSQKIMIAHDQKRL